FDWPNYELEAFFNEIGPTKSCFVATDSTNALPEDAERAITELPQKLFNNKRKLKIEFAITRSRNDNQDEHARLVKQSIEGSKLVAEFARYAKKDGRVIVHNLAFNTAADDVRKHFSPFGMVVDVNILLNKEKARSNGVAFVHMGTVEEAQWAIEKLNGSTLQGRLIAVDMVVSKEEHEKRQLTELMDDDDDDDDDDNADADGDDVDEAEAEAEQESDSEDEATPSKNSPGQEGSQKTEAASKVVESSAEQTDAAKKKPVTSTRLNSTVFIRNLSYEETEATLHEHFLRFGPIRHALITRDKLTNNSLGTGFVCFEHPEVAELCVQQAAFANGQANTQMAEFFIKPGRLPPAYKSVLEPEVSQSYPDIQNFMLHGRLVTVDIAVDRKEATRLREAKSSRPHNDKRNLYLLQEGALPVDSPLAAVLGPAEFGKRQDSYAKRRADLTNNPNLMISRTRLAIRNVPAEWDDGMIRRAALTAVAEFKKAVAKGDQAPLSPTEKSEGGWDHLPRLKQAIINRETIQIDPKTNLGRSRRSAFVEFVDHSHALAALRYLNNNPTVFTKTQRPIVEFAIDKKTVM
ncbi:hypothetical protein BJ085DRAFT_4236, partial [Dimargaris cristalligena]